MSVYYNENDPKAAAWLRELIAGGHIARGVVDERSIEDIEPAELAGYLQCHFFAGIGGWSYALRLAGWPDDKAVWTGSCPCQPFSAAGKAGGFADERHLWPAWFHLIDQCRPSIIFGEQVASKDGLGWFDLVHADLEGAGYAVGAADLCAAGVGAPHIRQRLYFVGVSDSGGRPPRRPSSETVGYGRTVEPSGDADCTRVVGDAHDAGSQGWCECRDRRNERFVGSSGVGVGQADAHSRAIGRYAGTAHGAQNKIVWGTKSESDRLRVGGRVFSAWGDAKYIECTDGKRRPAPVEPEFQPLAHGIPARMGRLRGYGNAIVPQVASAFIESVIDTLVSD